MRAWKDYFGGKQARLFRKIGTQPTEGGSRLRRWREEIGGNTKLLQKRERPGARLRIVALRRRRVSEFIAFNARKEPVEKIWNLKQTFGDVK